MRKIVPILIILLTPYAAAAQRFDVEKTIQKYMWEGGRYVRSYSSRSVGDVFTVEDRRPTKYPAKCFSDFPITVEQYLIPPGEDSVWKRGWRFPLDFDFIVTTGSKKEGEEGTQARVAIRQKPPDPRANRVIISLSFTGVRQVVHWAIISEAAAKWSDQTCLGVLKPRNSYVVVEVIQGPVTIQFFQEIPGQRKEIDFDVPSSWTRLSPGLFKTDYTFIVARHAEVQVRRSKVTGLTLTTYPKSLRAYK